MACLAWSAHLLVFDAWLGSGGSCLLAACCDELATLCDDFRNALGPR